MIALTPRAWLYLGAAGLMVAALTFGGCEHRNAAAARAERDQWKQAATSALDANTTNQDTIKTLRKSVDDWRKLAVPDDPSLAARVEKFRTENETLRRENDALARKADHDLPDCRQLLAIDFGRACPATARGLRDRAEGR